MVGDATGGVCVIIAAMNASATIGQAIRSALSQAQVVEVVVVDDGSHDGTADAAAAVDDGTGRLKVMRLEVNRGPSAARNYAILHSTAPLLAILDADDFFLPQRFDRMLAEGDWDFIADNILFMDGAPLDPMLVEAPDFLPDTRLLGLSEFIRGNLSVRGQPRAETGFLKPVMRRAFLDRHGLRYREEMRLGEDYDLYARALIAGARYKIIHGCGYGAVVRSNSLSGRHRTIDLKCLHEADRALLEQPSLQGEERRLVEQHAAQVKRRYELRRFLDEKAERGLWRTALGMLPRMSALPGVATDIFLDKYDHLKSTRAGPSVAVDEKLPRTLIKGRLAPATK